MKWTTHYNSGFYHRLMADGLIQEKDIEPPISGLEFYIEAFWELGTTRQLGMGAGPIPFTAISEYSKLYDVGDFEEFLYLVRRMDKVYLEIVNKEVSSDQRRKTNTGNNRR